MDPYDQQNYQEGNGYQPNQDQNDQQQQDEEFNEDEDYDGEYDDEEDEDVNDEEILKKMQQSALTNAGSGKISIPIFSGAQQHQPTAIQIRATSPPQHIPQQNQVLLQQHYQETFLYTPQQVHESQISLNQNVQQSNEDQMMSADYYQQQNPLSPYEGYPNQEQMNYQSYQPQFQYSDQQQQQQQEQYIQEGQPPLQYHNYQDSDIVNIPTKNFDSSNQKQEFIQIGEFQQQPNLPQQEIQSQYQIPPAEIVNQNPYYQEPSSTNQQVAQSQPTTISLNLGALGATGKIQIPKARSRKQSFQNEREKEHQSIRIMPGESKITIGASQNNQPSQQFMPPPPPPPSIQIPIRQTPQQESIAPVSIQLNFQKQQNQPQLVQTPDPLPQIVRYEQEKIPQQLNAQLQSPYQASPAIAYHENQQLPLSEGYQQPQTTQLEYQYQQPYYQHTSTQDQFQQNQQLQQQTYPIDQQMVQQQQWPMMDVNEQVPQQPKSSKRSEKKKKKKRQKGKGSLMELYDLTKIKFTMELDPKEKRLRGQTIYNLQIKSEEQVLKVLDKQKEENLKIVQLDLSFHSKKIQVIRVHVCENIDERQELLFDYPGIDQQARFQSEAFSNISRDLHSLEFKQKQIFENEQEFPILQAKRIAILNHKKDNVREQLKPQLKIIVGYVIHNISDFGIKAIQYKKQQNQFLRGGNAGQNSDDQEGTYFYTTDSFDSRQLWIPIIKGTNLQPVEWTIRYIVPSNYTVVSSGTLIVKQIEEQGEQRAMFLYKLRESQAAPPEKLGFVIGQFPIIHKMNDLANFCNSGAYAFFMSGKKQEIFTNNKFYEKNVFNILQYLQKLIGAPFPYNSLKLVFVPNLFLKSSRKQSYDFGGGLHILDEELLFQKNQLENRYHTYKYLASSLAFNFFGGRVYEETSEDYWLLLGIRENIGNHYKIVKCGVLIYRYHIMQTLQSLYRKSKDGVERYPLKSGQKPYPAEQMLNELVYEKCELIMHMIESMIDKSYFERIIKQLYESASPTVSTGLFLNIFKQVCGFKLKQFCQNWILSTSCPKLTATFNYNKKNNSLDLSIAQSSSMKKYFTFKKFLKQVLDQGALLSAPLLKNSPEFKQAIKRMEPLDNFFVELKRECMRQFTGEVNVMIYLTDGAEIQTQQQKMSLKIGKSQVSVNIPLHCKVKKTIQNKKKEYDNIMFDQDQNDAEDSLSDNQGGQSHHHIIDNSSWKFGLNDFEIKEKYPIDTKNLFEVKNLESPVLWIRVDPDMEYIRKVKVVQEQNNWLFQLLQEKDIIGQIEAIKQLYKYNQQFVYEILQAVSTNENFFFKVRKTALKYLQKMQASQFNRFLFHEKFLIQIFNQRNFDIRTGFYKSNDFTKVLEYYFDKYTLKTLAKCKESPLKIREEIKEEIKDQQMNLNKSQAPGVDQTSGGNISITIQGSTIISAGPQKTQIDESKFNVSSDQIAQLLLKVLQENDNSENPFDDSSYLKQILKSLGSLDNFKFMPEIAKEIYRQFRLDYIGNFSPQFAITKGAIGGYFNLRKQIFIFLRDKIVNLDPQLEDPEWYKEQINETQKTLKVMENDVKSILNDPEWPLEIRMFVIQQRIKHTFFYENNSFLKALYISIKEIDRLQGLHRVIDANFYLQQLLYFIEENSDKIDYKEAFLVNEKSQAIVQLLWDMVCLPFNYLDCTFIYWVKRLYHFLYSNEIPPVMKDWQIAQGINMEEIKYDESWAKVEDQIQENTLQDNKDRHMKQILASRSAQVIVRTPKADNRQGGDFGQRASEQQAETKLKIVLGNLDQSAFGRQYQNQQQQLQQQYQPGSIKIALGNIQIDTSSRNQRSQQQQQQYQQNQQSAFDQNIGSNDVEMINTYQNDRFKNKNYENEQAQQISLMQSLSNQNYANNQMQDYQQEDDESVYDEFAEIKFDIDWLQRAWEITGTLWYHEESAAFLEPVNQADLGRYFEYYMSIIDYPIDLTTIKTKIKEYQYNDINEWKKDIMTMFKNCKSFNQEGSDIYSSAVKLERFYWSQLRDYGLTDQRSTIRIT